MLDKNTNNSKTLLSYSLILCLTFFGRLFFPFSSVSVWAFVPQKHILPYLCIDYCTTQFQIWWKKEEKEIGRHCSTLFVLRHSVTECASYLVWYDASFVYSLESHYGIQLNSTHSIDTQNWIPFHERLSLNQIPNGALLFTLYWIAFKFNVCGSHCWLIQINQT